MGKGEWKETTGWPGGGNEREYMGWNEVPVDRLKVGDARNWDALVIKLPANICNKYGGALDSPYCLDYEAGTRLEYRINGYVDKGYVKPGLDYITKKPGSSVVFAREHKDQSGNWSRYAFCTSWISPNRVWEIVFS